MTRLYWRLFTWFPAIPVGTFRKVSFLTFYDSFWTQTFPKCPWNGNFFTWIKLKLSKEYVKNLYPLFFYLFPRNCWNFSETVLLFQFLANLALKPKGINKNNLHYLFCMRNLYFHQHLKKCLLKPLEIAFCVLKIYGNALL